MITVLFGSVTDNIKKHYALHFIEKRRPCYFDLIAQKVQYISFLRAEDFCRLHFTALCLYRADVGFIYREHMHGATAIEKNYAYKLKSLLSMSNF